MDITYKLQLNSIQYKTTYNTTTTNNYSFYKLQILYTDR